jgi:phage portal protein BeeE
VTSLWRSLRGSEERGITSFDDYLQAMNAFTYGGGVQQTLAGGPTERISGDFAGLARSAYKANGVVFSCMLVRQLVFSAARFRWQRLRDGKPSDTFGSSDLTLLERPWTGGTTQDMLSRLIQDADLAGNAFWTRDGADLIRLRPDWVDIVLEARPRGSGMLGWRRLGYLYTEGGHTSGREPVPLLAGDVAHFAPLPDPEATFRGMSWLTPIVREIQADGLMARHKHKYFEHGATPNMVIKHDVGATQDKIERFAAMLDENHAGVDKAYRTLHLYPGADATVVGSDLKQIDFKVVQGHGETRVAAAAGVPPVIVGLSEGLESATYSNYGQARRRFADGTMHPLWQNAAGSLAPVLPDTPSDVRLWYDTADVPFLREDEKDAAQIAETQARTIRTLVDGGYTPESVLAAVESGDWRLLAHTGLFSVQLQRPGSDDNPVPIEGSAP